LSFLLGYKADVAAVPTRSRNLALMQRVLRHGYDGCTMSEELYHSIELRASPVRYARSAASSQRQGKPFPGQQRALAR